MNGIVQSGAPGGSVLAVGGAAVSLYECDLTKSVLVGGPVTTSSNGAFTINADHSSSVLTFYVRAVLPSGVVLMALLGTELPSQITINELTTVAAVYCARQFLTNRLVPDGTVSGDPLGLRIAAGMSANVVDVQSGAWSAVLSTPPNGKQTNAWAASGSLANLLAACVRDPNAALEALFALATPPGGNAPTDTVQAMINIARYPANHVGALYEFSKSATAYQPALERQPDAWTLAVKVNDSGNDDYPFGGPGNLAFDDNGNVWITNNVVQGEPYSTNWSIVLGPSGQPALNSHGVKMSPFTGGGLVGPGFGVDIDSKGRVWIGNFGWGGLNPTPSGSVSVFDLNAKPVVRDGYQAGIYRVQGTVVDDHDNVWLAGYGSNSVAMYRDGKDTDVLVYQGDDTFVPFDIVPFEGGAWVTNSYKDKSGLVELVIGNGRLNFVRQIDDGKTVKGLVRDSLGNLWMASGGDNYVYAYTSRGERLGRFQGGGQDGPWGINVDGDDHIWVGNFGPLAIGSVFHGRLTQLAGANPNTRPAGLKMGDPMTPITGYTLPTGGEAVTLHDGTPLYGAEDEPPCFIPMMRTTGLAVDVAGNLWTCNNWKPSFNKDFIGDPMDPITTGNPGGDGMIMWLGVARPPRLVSAPGS